jgi:hypothetical protein
VNPRTPTSEAVDIPHNALCTSTSPADVSGWAAEGPGGGRVRICGQACTGLRTAISDVTKFALLQKQMQPDQDFAAPPVPVVVSAPCNEFTTRR